MAVVSDIEIRLRADIARLQQDMNAARRSVDGAMSSISKSAKNAVKALGGLAVGFAIGKLAGEVIEAQREFDKLNASLVTATGTASNAAQAFGALQRFASTTPYSVSEATEAFIKLRNLGLNPGEKALTSYGNTAAAMGKGLNQLIEAVADAATGEFERLKEFGIKAKQNGDQVALTFQGTTKVIGNNAKDIQKYLMDIGNVNFAGAMEKRLNTLDGAISNLGDSWQGTLRAISTGGFGEGVQSGVMALSNALSDLGDIFKAVGGEATTEGGKVKEAAGLHEALTTVFKGIAIVGVGLVAAFKEIGSELGALAAIGVSVAKGDFAGVKTILAARAQDAASLDTWLKGKIAAIQGSVEAGNKARDEEAANIAKNGGDALSQYEIQLTAEQKKDKALQDTMELRNKLNGVDAQTAGNLAKLKVAYQAGAISQADYLKYVAQINKETALASTAYKNGAKAIDMSTEAIKRRAQAQAFANQQDQENLDFLHRTGQLSDENFIAKNADAAVAALNLQKKALEDQRALLKGRYDTEKDRAALTTQIEGKEQEITARRTKETQEQFELEQKRYREAVGNTADLIEAAQDESRAVRDKTRDQQDEIELLGLTSKQIAEVTAARLRDQAAALDRRAEIGIIEEVNAALRQQAEELRKQADLGLTKERLQEQQKFWGDIEQTAHDTFVSIADGGKGAFQRLKDSAKNIFFEWLYQMTLKKWVINIGTSMTGGLGMSALAGAAGTAGVAGSAASTAGAVGLGGWLAGGGIGGSLAAGAGWVTGSTTLGGALGAGTSLLGTGTLAGGVAGAGVLVGAIAPLAIGAVLASAAWKSAFGMKDKKYSDASTLSGSLSSNSFNGTINTPWTQEGGWFRSDKSGVDKAAVDAMQASGLSAAYDAIKAASTSYASVLGLNADSIAARTQTVSIALGKDEAANQKAIADFFTGVGDTIASELLPTIGMFQAQGESTSTTLQRLAGDFQAIDGILAMMGTDSSTAFKAVGSASIEARERLIALAGGIEALSSQTTYYNENFLTQAERVAIIQKPLNEQLSALGYAGIATTEQFKTAVQGLVSSGALATAEGAKTYATLLAIAPQFKTVADYLKDVADASKETARAALEANETLLRGLVDTAVDNLGKAVDAQKDTVTKAYEDAMSVLDKSIDGVNSTISRTAELSAALKSAMRGVESPDQAIGSRMAAQAQITTALAIAKASGVLPSIDDLRDAFSTLGNDASDQFSTLADYQRDVARTNNELDQLGGITDKQLSAAEQQLQVLQDTKNQAQAAYQAEITRLDNLVNVVLGVNTTAMSILEAVANVKVAQAALAGGATPSNPNGGNLTVSDLYRTVLGREGEQAGLDYWNGVFGSVVDSDEYAAFVKGALPELQMQQNQVPMVNSPVQNGTIGGNSAMLSELQTMNKRLEAIEVTNAQSASATNKFAGQFEQVSGGGNAVVTFAG